MSRRASWLVLGAVALLAVACQAGPPAPRGEAPDAGAAAASALARDQYREAAELYRRALVAAPASVPLHFGLGVALSHLALTNEAIAEFRWVVGHGQAGSSEVETARSWLQRVGALPAPVRRDPAPSGQERQPGQASLEGHAVFGPPGTEPKPVKRLQLYLIGQPDGQARDERYVLRTDEDGRFRFANVRSGSYKLTNRIAGTPIWRLRVELAASQDVVLDLDPRNSVTSRDDFPEQQ